MGKTTMVKVNKQEKPERLRKVLEMEAKIGEKQETIAMKKRMDISHSSLVGAVGKETTMEMKSRQVRQVSVKVQEK